LIGSRRYLDRLWRLRYNFSPKNTTPEVVDRELNKLIKKVGEDIEEFKFNTAIASLMTFQNVAEKEGITESQYDTLLTVVAPFAPMIVEELAESLGHTESTHLRPYPSYDPKKLISTVATVVVQINGKVRASLEVPVGIDEGGVKALIIDNEKIQKNLEGLTIKKYIYIQDKLLSIVAV
jgi:leucyl-tRNA synthetase